MSASRSCVRLYGDAAQPGGVSAVDVAWRVTDGDRIPGGPAAGAPERELDQRNSGFAFATESTLLRREEARESEPLHPGTGDRLGIAGE